MEVDQDRGGEQHDDEQEEREQEERGEDRPEQEAREQDEQAQEEQEQEQEEQEREGEDDGDEQAARPSISAREMTTSAMEALEDLTGHTPEAATGLMWDGDSWLVTVDVLELSRIPNTTDILATYVVQLDGDGNLSGYKRTKRFQRSQAEEG